MLGSGVTGVFALNQSKTRFRCATRRDNQEPRSVNSIVFVVGLLAMGMAMLLDHLGAIDNARVHESVAC